MEFLGSIFTEEFSHSLGMNIKKYQVTNSIVEHCPKARNKETLPEKYGNWGKGFESLNALPSCDILKYILVFSMMASSYRILTIFSYCFIPLLTFPVLLLLYIMK